MNWKLTLASLSFMLVSCGVNPVGTGSHSLNGLGYNTVTPGNLLHNSTTVSGTGSIVFTDLIAEGVNSGKSFRVTFELDPDGVLELVTYSNNGLSNGVNVQFTRSGPTLVVVSQTKENSVNLSPFFASTPATGDLTFQIDVHNDEANPHIVMWPGSVTDFSSAPMVNSDDLTGKGGGAYWGFNLKNAVLKSATISGPQFDHERGHGTHTGHDPKGDEHDHDHEHEHDHDHDHDHDHGHRH